MCYAWVWYVVEGVIAVVGGYTSVKSSQNSARAIENQQRYNAELGEQRAELADREKVRVAEAAALDRRRLAERYHEITGDTRAKYASMGLDPALGTPADLIGDSKRAYDIDRSIISDSEQTERYSLDLEKHGYAVEAGLGKMRAEAARKGANLESIGYALDTASSVSSIWTRNRTPRSTTTTSTTTKRPIKVGVGA